MIKRWLAVCVIAGGAIAMAAALTPHERALNEESFEYVWTTIRDKYWDPSIGGLDWQAIHDELKPKMEKARTMAEARAVLEEMLGRLHLTHFEIIPEDSYWDVDGENLPRGDGETGLDIRVVDHQALVTQVDRGSPGEHEGVHTGWEVVRAGKLPLAPAIGKVEAVYSKSSLRELMLRNAVLSRMRGYPGDTLELEFRDGEGRRAIRKLRLDSPRGEYSKFGYLPGSYVWLNSEKLGGDTGYVRFNMFLDPAHLMPRFADAVKSCQGCRGFIIDLRGNPGGIGAMAMGMAGWFVGKPGERLGTLYLRNSKLNFSISPRPEVFTGPLAILVDGTSASTSEILAGGLKDLGRARIFGLRTAAAALPSAIEKLPNGDGFQYAMANYISEGGKPLEGLGVTPDVVTPLTRAALLAGKDPALDAALEWIRTGKVQAREAARIGVP